MFREEFRFKILYLFSRILFHGDGGFRFHKRAVYSPIDEFFDT
jgi:hypothetical protein